MLGGMISSKSRVCQGIRIGFVHRLSTGRETSYLFSGVSNISWAAIFWNHKTRYSTLSN